MATSTSNPRGTPPSATPATPEIPPIYTRLITEPFLITGTPTQLGVMTGDGVITPTTSAPLPWATIITLRMLLGREADDLVLWADPEGSVDAILQCIVQGVQRARARR